MCFKFDLFFSKHFFSKLAKPYNYCYNYFAPEVFGGALFAGKLHAHSPDLSSRIFCIIASKEKARTSLVVPAVNSNEFNLSFLSELSATRCVD